MHHGEIIGAVGQNLVFTRDSSIWIGRGRRSRRRHYGHGREASLTIYAHHPRFTGVRRRRIAHAPVEGGDVVARPGCIAVGVGERLHQQAREALARSSFDDDLAHTVLRCADRSAARAMHLDTVQ